MTWRPTPRAYQALNSSKADALFMGGHSTKQSKIIRLYSPVLSWSDNEDDVGGQKFVEVSEQIFIHEELLQ